MAVRCSLTKWRDKEPRAHSASKALRVLLKSNASSPSAQTKP